MIVILDLKTRPSEETDESRLDVSKVLNGNEKSSRVINIHDSLKNMKVSGNLNY